MFRLAKEQLLSDLFDAFITASTHKANKSYVIEYKEKLESNLSKLCDELYNRTYIAKPSVCFIVDYPKKREIFAADFRDRIVHHLYFNYVHALFENTFIYDSYSCIKGKGTHFGINRCRKHIVSSSNNYQNKAYCLKMDIKGYFIHIDRELLCQIAKYSIHKMLSHKVGGRDNRLWGDVIDIDFIDYLTETIALLNPIKNCRIRGDKSNWDGLPESKSLFCVEDGYGLPIGNLTSQLFSNVFLNRLDQYVKRELGCKHYGRYVDDFFIISDSKKFLHTIIPKIETFLKEELHLDINKGKTIISEVKQGVEFLGAFIKPNRTYISNQSYRRIRQKLFDIDNGTIEAENPVQTINSYLGIFVHTKSLTLRQNLFDELAFWRTIGYFNEEYTKFIPYEMS